MLQFGTCPELQFISSSMAVFLKLESADLLETHMIRKCVLPESISKYHELWVSKIFAMNRLLIGEVTKSMRGVTLNFDGKIIQIIAFFDSPPSEKEIDAMQDIEAEFVAGHEYMSDLILEFVPVSESLIDKAKNWGWVYLRRDD